MRDDELLMPLEIELKKVAILGGSLALVVVPSKYADKVVAAKRDMDTALRYQDFEVVGMIGTSLALPSTISPGLGSWLS